ncbi:hypothetical protein DFH08DRAFT_826334 [Mycena albidolilacea]|uniref:Uncharacterized protein n=1 Tax=Mycena albidolilacea TaxID=1033008 RepID=A0AAD6Z0N4_9AGAR|nr:hypothetical protein DFH08DRAFT_826334 [Mycena albidolilacea]
MSAAPMMGMLVSPSQAPPQAQARKPVPANSNSARRRKPLWQARQRPNKEEPALEDGGEYYEGCNAREQGMNIGPGKAGAGHCPLRPPAGAAHRFRSPPRGKKSKEKNAMRKGMHSKRTPPGSAEGGRRGDARKVGDGNAGAGIDPTATKGKLQCRRVKYRGG